MEQTTSDTAGAGEDPAALIIGDHFSVWLRGGRERGSGSTVLTNGGSSSGARAGGGKRKIRFARGLAG